MDETLRSRRHAGIGARAHKSEDAMLNRQTTAPNSDNEIFIRLESKVQSYARNFPAVFSYARGTELRDVHGKRYLDFLAGAGSLNIVHNNPIFKEALIEYIEQDGIT